MDEVRCFQNTGQQHTNEQVETLAREHQTGIANAHMPPE